jgi:hypothetical protein
MGTYSRNSIPKHLKEIWDQQKQFDLLYLFVATPFTHFLVEEKLLMKLEGYMSEISI